LIFGEHFCKTTQKNLQNELLKKIFGEFISEIEMSERMGISREG
jgi:hypothetical protein